MAETEQPAWLRPRTLGLKPSFGFGDRLGLATPGHIAALRRAGGGLAPIFAQQSVRENRRTGRSPAQVLQDAVRGVREAGWREGFGADADHLKTVEDVDAFAAAGYTFFTFDPGEHVDASADALPAARLTAALEAFPWARLETDRDALFARYRGVREEEIARATLKYGGAVAHVTTLYRRLADVATAEFEVEVSVDETESPTTPFQHRLVATELRRLGVEWVSLAPRFIGRFEKGVDYIGDVASFAADCQAHAALAREVGPYKLSLHSGSDKLTVYPAFREAAGDLAHVKTAGTSYLEALRTLARTDPALFREVLDLGRASYESDRASYHVSARAERVPAAKKLADEQLPGLLDDFDAREVLHVTFGTVLDQRGERLHASLERVLDDYRKDLESHFVRHLAAFGRVLEVGA